MRFQLSIQAQDQYEALTPPLRKSADKQFAFLVANIRHPSLHAKKYEETSGLWQARINQSWRFYFIVRHDLCYIVSIRKHPK